MEGKYIIYEILLSAVGPIPANTTRRARWCRGQDLGTSSTLDVLQQHSSLRHEGFWGLPSTWIWTARYVGWTIAACTVKNGTLYSLDNRRLCAIAMLQGIQGHDFFEMNWKKYRDPCVRFAMWDWCL